MPDSTFHPPVTNSNLDGKLPNLGDWESIPALLESQLPKLSSVVHRARQAPFYSSRLGDDFFSAAQTTKPDLRRASPFGFLAIPKNRLATYHESSGTSGEPTASFFSESDWEDVITRFSRSAINLNADDTLLIKTPYSLVTTAHQMHLAAIRLGALIIPGDNRSSNIPYSKVVRLLQQLEVTVAWCMPTEVLLWAEAAKLNGFDPKRDFPALRAFWVAGEPLTLNKRRRLEVIFGETQVFQDYGSTETGSLAGECSAGNLHLWADRLFCEVWDQKTQTYKTSGRGKLVVTTLYREAMPLIRYALEDEVEVSHQNCTCGWNLPMVRVLGRSESALSIQGKTCFPSDLESLVYGIPEADAINFWRARYSQETLLIELEGPKPLVKAASLYLENQILAELGIKASVSGTPTGIVSKQRLTETAAFMKPTFVFKSDQDWSKGIHY